MKSLYVLTGCIVLLSFQFSSCTKDASDDSYARLPGYEPKLAMTAFVSPDQNPNRILITTTIARFGERTVINPHPVKLVLLEDFNEVQIDTFSKTIAEYYHYYYIRNLKFKEGHTYTLKVTSDAGFEASGTCQIPQRHDFEIKVDTSSRKMTDEWGSNLLIPSAKISIKDAQGEPNFYRLLFYNEIYIKSGKKSLDSSPDNPVTPAWNPSVGDVMYNDIGRDGQRIILRSIEFFPINLSPNVSNIEYDSAFLRVYLLSTDKPYNDFHLSLHNYTTGEDPFTEPSFLYSNIVGGVGIFASYIIDSLIFRLK
jgi:hypothetical protein